MPVRILTADQLRTLVPLNKAAVETVSFAFAKLAEGGVEMPPILSLRVPEFRGEIDVKTAYVPGLEHIAIKVSPGFFENPKLGLPSLNGLMVVLAAQTGLLTALLLDKGYLTDIRTAAAGAVAADLLARKQSETVAVLGAGRQAYLQVQALMLVRPVQHIQVWARNPESGQRLGKVLMNDFKLRAHVAPTVKDAVRDVDIIVTTTPAEKPILDVDWVSPGQHITAMGSDAEYKNEIDPRIIAAADIYVPDRQAQCRKLGELRTAIAAGLVSDQRRYPELGEIVREPFKGRSNELQMTVADLTGTGIQDTAIAALAVRRAVASDIGTMLDS